MDLYAEPYAPERPKGNCDDTSKPLLADKPEPLAAQPGQPQRYGYEYERGGTRNLFLFCEPPAGWRHMAVTEHRAKVDFAPQRKWLVEERYPEAAVIRVALDHLNTPKPASLSEAFAPEEARRLAKKLEVHSTPEHGSGLSMAEIELRVRARQCLDRRIPGEAALKQEVQAYQARRNAGQAPSDWRCSMSDARRKLHRLYPSTLMR